VEKVFTCLELLYGAQLSLSLLLSLSVCVCVRVCVCVLQYPLLPSSAPIYSCVWTLII